MKNRLLVLCYATGCLLFGICLSFAIYHIVSDPQSDKAPEPTEVSETLMLQEETRTTAPETTAPRETASGEITAETEAATEPTETEAPTEEPEQKPGPVYTVVYCTGDSVNVRSGPGTSYEAIGRIKWGQSVDWMEEVEGWSKVIFENQEAYISSRYLSDTEPTEPETTAPAETKASEKETKSAETQPQETLDIKMEFKSADETVYCTGTNVNIRKGPGTDYDKVGKLQIGDSMRRTGIGDKWSRVEISGKTAYVSSTYLSTENPEGRSKPSSPLYGPAFSYSYETPEGIMPFALFTPSDYQGDRQLPLIISLHGHSETGRGQGYFENKFLVRDFKHWEATGLAPFDAYVVCPHLTGPYTSDGWNNPDAAWYFFTLLDYVVNNYNVDRSRIILQGQSMGAQGALYLAADTRACFSKLVLVSGYEPYRDYSGISIPVRGYSGSPDIPRPREDRTSYNFMARCFSNQFGLDNWYVRPCSHDAIPLWAFHEDLDGDGQSDLISWMLQ